MRAASGDLTLTDAHALKGSILLSALGTGTAFSIIGTSVSVCAIYIEWRVHGLLVILVARGKSSGTNTVELTLAFYTLAAGATFSIESAGERNCRSKCYDDQKCFDEFHVTSLSCYLKFIR